MFTNTLSQSLNTSLIKKQPKILDMCLFVESALDDLASLTCKTRNVSENALCCQMAYEVALYYWLTDNYSAVYLIKNTLTLKLDSGTGRHYICIESNNIARGLGIRTGMDLFYIGSNNKHENSLSIND